MHPGEALRDGPCLVGLQPADEVPGELDIAQRRHLLERFLQITLAEVPHAEACGRAHERHRLRLAHGEECDGVDTALPPGGGACDAITDVAHTLR